MKKLVKLYKDLLNEEILKEYHTDADGDINYEIFDRIDEFKRNTLSKFLFENNDDYTANIPWRLISFPRLKRIWEQWAKFGFVRDEKGLQMIEDIMISNTIKIDALTTLSGHSPESTDEDYEDAWGHYVESFIKQWYSDFAKSDEKHHSNDPDQLEFDWQSKDGDGKRKDIEPTERVENAFLLSKLEGINPMRTDPMRLKKQLMDELKGNFMWHYIEDPAIGQARISDYGLKPLQELAGQLLNTHDSSAKVVIIDRMLNVVHQRSDMASWYVQGGTKSLFTLSASPSEIEDEKQGQD